MSGAAGGRLRGALIGCGFFARNHLHAWQELPGVDIVALCDQEASRAEAYAAEFGGRAYADPGEMLRHERPDFVDIVTQVGTHRALVERAAGAGVHVVCQKPLALDMHSARAMVDACRDAGVQFMVHENFRWQAPMRAVKDAAAQLGRLFFGRIQFRTPYDVYADQPYLATDERFILTDVGVHLLDLARFFMGEFAALHAHTQRVNPAIRGEDVATVMLRSRDGASCIVDMSYASKLEHDLFPQTLVHLEGERGSVTLGADYQLTVVSDSAPGFRSGLAGARVRREDAAPPRRAWATPPADVIQDSVVRLQQHWVECLRTNREPETSGRDNLRTLELVFGAYEDSARAPLSGAGSGV